MASIVRGSKVIKAGKDSEEIHSIWHE